MSYAIWERKHRLDGAIHLEAVLETILYVDFVRNSRRTNFPKQTDFDVERKCILFVAAFPLDHEIQRDLIKFA